MTVECIHQGSAEVVRLSGRMNEELALQFEQACRGSLEAGIRHLIVDIAELEYLSSVGLRSFVRVVKSVHGTDRTVVLCGMKGIVKEIFELAHMGGLFQTFDGVDAALASLG
ncbi:MAG TPA: STAS domain-containing protein [Terracidiphilus sp.]|nr:STAS domain-containing protein [Terracidiphilus sp.]